MFSIIIAFIGFQEIVFIIFVAVLIFGPSKIPEIARGLGEGVRAMREATDEIKREVMSSAEKMDPSGEIKDSVKEIQHEIDEAKKEIDDAVGPVKREG
ncbi:twin-arginine translocase TatA/TatE family subunit [Ornithobacterium rhinotracheale]|uniref:Sec-independent protein secretion pathway component n=1 Tax=Ornithobacterium rhinotracheale (strain ATCC 51463 / DSM 15997 / CCUG 23171 / CIP 104009 / LMG 9086) TaxID=867902 RepID=I3ZXZ4_ORNRL|nr:twin-arginine translocase TatA/TatE family subunit [Ornithobacterium rhinotracheale]AFL96578.1 Sec-independent protein secretion pathway component [Ornithobacterium rhinotracheale DSM 15997]AIP98757.1 sec-independent translocation protein mttA/Hcf106 [Ornithobacterium rhinotracheale ORT-UMN 88]KGB67726.1 sec-independent translocation protein mttA/Hcf106 [Ornithobacterium rhinotracheale H06-030791]MBN3663149.1 twin-arginine translocase TatA/TatE family subunit [Ornithobacterium rhinotracheale